MAKGSEKGGCLNCYAARLHARNLPNLVGITGKPLARILQSGPRWSGDVGINEKALDLPLRWKRPRRIFVNSQSDLFHEDLTIDQIERVWRVMCGALHRGHTFQILTKRAARMAELVTPIMNRIYGFHWRMPDGIWLGVSVENQKTADERIPALLQAPASMRFVSYEPALGPIIFRPEWLRGMPLSDGRKLSQIIMGGESGPGARPMHSDWVRSTRDQCLSTLTPFFFKQWGEWSPNSPNDFHRVSARRYSCRTFAWGKDGNEYNPSNPAPDDFPQMMYRVGRKKAAHLVDGVEWHQFPAVPTC